MKRVLLTGMSGTGKSAVIRELAASGVDLPGRVWPKPVPSSLAAAAAAGEHGHRSVRRRRTEPEETACPRSA